MSQSGSGAKGSSADAPAAPGCRAPDSSSGQLVNRNWPMASLRVRPEQLADRRLFHKLAHSNSTNSLPADKRAQQQHQQQHHHQHHSRQQSARERMVIQASNRLQLHLSQGPNPNKPINKRLEIIRELINTEKAHTDRLRCLNKLFYIPLRENSLMSQDQLKSVFSCHRRLYKIHKSIYKCLMASANYGYYLADPLIGSALVDIFEGPLRRQLERAACAFCSAQATNRDLLDKLTRKETKTGEFLAQVTSQQIVSRLGIKDLLASCFQRLTKYPLLLENLLKATPDRPPGDDNCRHHNEQAIKLNPSSRSSLLDSIPGEISQQQQQQQQLTDNNQMAAGLVDQQARRMLAISLPKEREFIERALIQSREILIKVNESVQVAVSRHKLKEIWDKTDKYPGVPLKDITNQHLLHDGSLTLRLGKRTYDVYMLLLDDYIILLTRDSQDKYRLKFFTSEGKFVVNQSSSLYSPVFVIDEHLTTRDAATDEHVFYLVCKRKDDSRIYEFAARSAQERLKWCDHIQRTIERQLTKSDRRPSYISFTSTAGESSITKSSSDFSSRLETDQSSGDTPPEVGGKKSHAQHQDSTSSGATRESIPDEPALSNTNQQQQQETPTSPTSSSNKSNDKPPSDQLVGTISYVEDDGIIEAHRIVISRPIVGQATLVRMPVQAD